MLFLVDLISSSIPALTSSQLPILFFYEVVLVDIHSRSIGRLPGHSPISSFQDIRMPAPYSPESEPCLSSTSLPSSDDTVLDKNIGSFPAECTCHRRKPGFRRLLPAVTIHLGFLCLYALISFGLVRTLYRPQEAVPCIVTNGGNGGNEAVVHCESSFGYNRCPRSWASPKSSY